MKKCFIVSTDEQLQNCIQSKVDVEIWWEEELNLISRIISFDELCIKFAEGNYLRGNVVLKARGNYLRRV